MDELETRAQALSSAAIYAAGRVLDPVEVITIAGIFEKYLVTGEVKLNG